ncbi:unnamed protein product [Anisakis simplex]|uniref:Cytosolic carboxypeptidase 1 n=1 Tax=Anisakis simplex TaxID=6269 RepID=A0A0M3JU55_ANISI|nr:unnamed protein product [Anisakis simplex]
MRGKAPQSRDEDRLRKLHRQLEAVVNEEPDDQRRRRLRHILPAVNCIREQLLFLRQCLHSTQSLSTAVYISRAHVALSDITKQSEEEEFRKLATIIGTLDAVAENLILELDAFGVNCGVEHREIRKLIASALTNLTFGNALSKRRLCAYPNFIDYVIRVVDDSHKLAQVYAGLLRNLSWMADAEMSATLSPTVVALSRASLRAYRAGETKCLCATLSALWNLASHSRDNKKAICEQSGFIDMIIELLTTEAQHTTLVEPASGVLKYASMYLAVVGANQLLSTTALHKMVLRLVDLLNSPSFTVIGNSLGVLSQLLAKDHSLRVHLRLNHKAMQLLNHLRNSTRDDIRNVVKTVLEYLNSADLSIAFADRPLHPYTQTATATSGTSYRADGMSSSYSGTATDTQSFMDTTSRRLKLRSAHSHAPSSLLTAVATTSAGLNNVEAASLFTPCAIATQHSFAPRPGLRQQQQQFASLPRHYFQRTSNKYATDICSSDRTDTASDLFAQPHQSAITSSFITAGNNFASPLRLLPSHQVQKESTSSQTQTTTSNYLADDRSDGLLAAANEEFDYSELARLEMRSDDPSFEVEDSVRCTRCTSAQSLSSLLPGDKSAWESCNNSAMNSNRLSPASATDLPDSPTQCMPLSSHHDVTIPSASELIAVSENIVDDAREKERSTQDADGNSTDIIPQTNTLSRLVDQKLNITDRNDDQDSFSRNKEEVTKQSSCTGDDGDYRSFVGQTDSELLNQSIEAAMPKRIETNEDFLADMIEEVQPKPSPHSRRQLNAARNFSSASTARIHSAASSMKSALSLSLTAITAADDDDFLLASIASVLPQSSCSSRHEPSSSTLALGSPPKKVRAVTGETARASTGPNKRNPPAVAISNPSASRHTVQTCLCVNATNAAANDGESHILLSSENGNMSSSAALFNAALQSSSLVESAKTSEKVRDACLLRHHLSNEGSDTLSDDNYSRLDDEEEMDVDTKVPEDVVEEFHAEQVLIDCNIICGTTHSEAHHQPPATISASRIATPLRTRSLLRYAETLSSTNETTGEDYASLENAVSRSKATSVQTFDRATVSSGNVSAKSKLLAKKQTVTAAAASSTRSASITKYGRDVERGVAPSSAKLNKRNLIGNSSATLSSGTGTVSRSLLKCNQATKPRSTSIPTSESPTTNVCKLDKLSSKLNNTFPRGGVNLSTQNDLKEEHQDDSNRHETEYQLSNAVSSDTLTTASGTPRFCTNNSVRVSPFNYKNPKEQNDDEKTSAEKTKKKRKKTIEANNGSSVTLQSLHDELKEKQQKIKQMLVTTV